ncbi:MAG TPA: transporter [Vicinamibacterales bacterium]|nr:transporter [Vicinamibacterales bacterium]
MVRCCLAIALVLGAARPVCAQDLAPAAYNPGPTRMNVLTFLASFNNGDVTFDPALPIENARATIGAGVIGYTRSFGLAGRYANISVGLPYGNGHIEGMVLGERRQRSPAGLGDIVVRTAVNLYGARAMSPQEFASYKQKTIVGASLVVVMPVGAYDSTKAINVGSNRWAFKPEIGVAHRAGAWTFEGDFAMLFYTDNTNFFNGALYEQDPIVAVQGHVIRAFKPGLWAAFDANFWRGGRPTTNGVPGSELQKNSRVGATLALPIKRQHQLRVAYSFGAYTRLGGDFNALGVSYSYVWR